MLQLPFIIVASVLASKSTISTDVKISNQIPAINLLNQPSGFKCPDGYKLKGFECIREYSVPAVSICPTPSKNTRGKCIISTDPELSCPYGYVDYNDECLNREITEADIKCPPDATLQTINIVNSTQRPQNDVTSMCLRKVAVPLVTDCKVGTLYKNECIVEKAIPALTKCKPGATIVDGYCLHTEKVNCSNTVMNGVSISDLLLPLKGSIQSHLMGGRPLRGLAEAPNFYDIPNISEFNQSKIVSIDNECYQHVTMNPIYYCKKGQLQGSECIIKEKAESDLVCPALGSVNDCFTYDHISPQRVCPPGYTKQCKSYRGKNKIECQCEKINHEPKRIYCPVGYVLNKTKCETEVPPVLTCKDSIVSSDGYCNVTETINATPVFGIKTALNELITAEPTELPVHPIATTAYLTSASPMPSHILSSSIISGITNGNQMERIETDIEQTF